MNDAEQRRRTLLEQSYDRYRETEIPAIHPGCRMAYRNLYGPEEPERESLGIRTFLCMVLFAVFVFMQKEEKEFLHVNSTKVIQEIRKNTDVTETWKNIPEKVSEKLFGKVL